MALFIRQDENRTELQNKLAKELQERLKTNPKLISKNDGVDDSEYIKNTKITPDFASIWIVISVIIIIAIIWLMIAV